MRKLLLASVLLLAACGNDDAGPIDPQTVQEICETVCVRDVMCDPTQTQEACVAECASSVPPTIRGDVYEAAADCVAALPCDGNEEACLQCEPTDAHRDYEARCRTALAACDVPADQLDGSCSVEFDPATETGYFCLLTSDAMRDATACFDLPTCEEQSTCLSAVFDTTSN